MKLENVNVGDKFSTMSKFYKLLELPSVKGNQRKAQNDEVARWFSWELTGTNKRATNEIIITEIRATPLEKVDGRVNNYNHKQSKYHDLDMLILDMLVNNNGHVYGTRKDILSEYLKLVDKNLLMKDNLLIGATYKVAENSVRQYKYIVNNLIESVILGSLNRLQRQGLIKWNKDYFIMSNKMGNEPILTEFYGGDIKQIIIDIEEEVLIAQGITRKDLYNNQELSDEFYNDTRMILQEKTHKDIWTYWNVYNIKLVSKVDKLIEVDKAIIAKKFTDVLLITSHTLLAKNVNKKNDNVIGKSYEDIKHYWLTDKLIKFVLKFEKKLFIHADGKIINGDVRRYSSVKVGNILQCKEEKVHNEDELSFLPY